MEEAIAASTVKETGVKVKSWIREYVVFILWVVVIVFVIRTCIVQNYRIPSRSMEDTMLVGDHLLVNKFIYGIRVPFTDLRLPMVRAPKQGDVIVFRYPMDRSKDFIKRVIGVPGDVIEIRDKQVFVNGRPYINPHEVHKDSRIFLRDAGLRDNFGPVLVPEDSWFVMGDNRDESHDSRFWGFVKKTDLVGLAVIKYWSWDKDRFRVRWNRIGRIID
jgi:signal peptidase I